VAASPWSLKRKKMTSNPLPRPTNASLQADRQP
jgi:hypothetical protein